MGKIIGGLCTFFDLEEKPYEITSKFFLDIGSNTLANTITYYFWIQVLVMGGAGADKFFSEISIFENLCSHNSNASKNTKLVFENIIFC